MDQEKFEREDGGMLNREEIERIVRDCGVKEGDNTLDLEYVDEAGNQRIIHWMKFRKIMTEEGLKTTEEDILAKKEELGL